MSFIAPVIVVPGITATYLRDAYPLPPEFVWTVLRKRYERVALHPDDHRYEALEPSRVEPDQIFPVAYEELIEELRYNLAEREDRPVPVYPFSYDWRQPLDAIEEKLGAFVNEVIDRTKLLKHYHRAGYGTDPRVNLVGHSMGGLIITGFLQRARRTARVAKVVTLATPFQGTFEAVIKITTGTANLGVDAPSSREREAARLTPALYHLLPSFKAGLEVEPGLPESLFDPGIWQPSVLKTIAEYVKRHSVVGPRDRQPAEAIFEAMLSVVRDHRTRIDEFRLSNAGMGAEDWLCVVGVDSVTRVSLKVERRRAAPDFNFRSDDRKNQWEDTDPQSRRLTGDGTVPFEGAVPNFLELRNLVCVSPDDFGYWEIQDRLTTKLAGFHGILPNMNMLHRLIVRHFIGRRDRHGNTWGRPAPGVRQWAPPIANLKPKETTTSLSPGEENRPRRERGR